MLQYQPKLYQICPSAYGVDATSIRIGKSLVGGGGGGITEKYHGILQWWKCNNAEA